MKHLLSKLFAVLLLTILIGATANAIMVQPMVISIKAKPGDTVPFKIKLAAKEDLAETVNFSLVQPMQKLNGAFEFKAADPQMCPEVKWLTFNTGKMTIPKGQEKEVSGTIKIPMDARGYHLIAVMVDQPQDKQNTPLVLLVRYAVKIEIYIDAPAPRPTALVTDYELLKGPQGEPLMQFKVKNTSQLQYGMDASVVIRNSKTKKLIERVRLKPEYFFKNNSDPVIIPGAELQFSGSPKEALLPGQYDLQLLFRYGSSGQTLLKKTVEIKTGDFTYPAGKLKAVRLDSNIVTFSGRPGGMSIKGVKFENRSDKSVTILLKPDDSMISNSYSILKNNPFELKNGKEFILEPGRVAVAIMSVQFPKDSPAQGNYGQLRVLTFVEGNPDPIEESLVQLEAITQGKFKISAEATDLSSTLDNGKLLLSAIVRNTGNIKIAPQATIRLSNDKGQFIETIDLTAQEDNDSVLPLKLITLSGITNENLTPGNYKAEIKIIQGSEQIGSSVLDLQVK